MQEYRIPEKYGIPRYGEPVDSESIHFSRRWGTLAAVSVAALGLVVGGAHLKNRFDSPEMIGEQTVQVEDGDTLDGIINEHVEHGASHTGEVSYAVRNNPANVDVFDNGMLDAGEYVVIPLSAKE